MSASLPLGMVLTTAYWFEECLKRNCTIFQFPLGSNLRGVGKLGEGSVCLILAKPQTKAPRRSSIRVIRPGELRLARALME
jgi:hypothetical protein